MQTVAELTELVHTVARAVEELSQLVELMPDRMDARLAAIQEGIGASITGMFKRLDESDDQISQLRAFVDTTLKSTQLNVSETVAQLQQVIADNRKTGDDFNETVTQSLQQHGETIKQVTQQIAELASTTRNEFNTLATKAAEFEQNVETRFKYGEGVNADAVTALRTTVDETLAGVNVQVQSNAKDIGEARTELRTFVESTNTAHSRFVVRLDETDGGIAQGLDAVRKDFGEQLETLTLTVSSNTDGMRVFDASLSEVSRFITDVVKSVSDNETSTIELVRKAKAATAELAVTVSEIDQRTKNMGDFADADTVMKRFAALETTVSERAEGATRALTDLEQSLNSRIEAFGQRVSGQEEALSSARTEVAEFTSSIADGFGKLDLRVADHEGATKNSLAQLAATDETTQKELAQVVHRLGEMDESVREGHSGIVRSVRLLASDVEDTNRMMVGHVERIDGTFTQVREFIDGAFVKSGENLASAVNGIEERLVKLDGTVAEKFNGIEHTFERIQAQVQAANDSNDERYGKTHTAVESVLKLVEGLDESVDNRFSAIVAGNTAAFERVHDTLRTLDSRIDGVDRNAEHFVTKTLFDHAMERQGVAAAENVMKVANQFGTRLDDVREKFDQSIAALPAPPIPPEPFDPAPLRVELLNRVAEMMPQLEVKDLGFDVALGDDQSLLFTFSYGETEVVRKVPLDIGFSYRGVYRPGEDYVAGNMVTNKGSLWVAKGRPTGEPGKDITGWQLAVKCGRDGKDAVPTRSYSEHTQGRVYRETDFLRLNNRLWQCVVKETTVVPEPGDIRSTAEWTFIGGIQ